MSDPHASLAAQTGIASSTIAGIETGQTKDLKISTLIRLCGYFLVSPDYLLGFDDRGDQFARNASGTSAAQFEAPTVREAREGQVVVKCPKCHHGMRLGQKHAHGECMMHAADRGRSHAYIAAAYGLSVRSVEFVLRDEYARRHRLKGIDDPPRNIEEIVAA